MQCHALSFVGGLSQNVNQSAIPIPRVFGHVLPRRLLVLFHANRYRVGRAVSRRIDGAGALDERRGGQPERLFEEAYVRTRPCGTLAPRVHNILRVALHLYEEVQSLASKPSVAIYGDQRQSVAIGSPHLQVHV